MKNNYGVFFRLMRALIKVVYPKYDVQVPTPNQGPIVYISHHQNLFGPFITLLWFPSFIRTWMLYVFLDQHSCYKQYANYTFTKRFGWNKVVAKLIAMPLSYAITKLLQSSRGIPVYRGSKKIIDTFRISVETLQHGNSIIIFPNVDYTSTSAYTKNIYSGFLYLEKYYYQKTRNHLCFVPLYASKSQRKILANRPIYFSDTIDFKKEQEIVLKKIQDSLNQLANKCGDI